MIKVYIAEIIGTNKFAEHLLDQKSEATLQFIGDKPPYQGTNQHIFFFGGKEYLLDIKETKFTLEGALVYGNLQDEQSVGKIALLLK